LTRNLETFKVITWTIKRETNVKRTLVNAERINPMDMRASRNEDAREDVEVVGESGQSTAYNDPLRETSGKLHSARRRDPALRAV